MAKKMRNQYDVGDRVVKSGAGLSFHGTVKRVMAVEAAETLMNTNTDLADEFRKQFEMRDKDWKKSCLYTVVPDSSPGPASFEEARAICPILDMDSYRKIMGSRLFLCLESDLLPELEKPPAVDKLDNNVSHVMIGYQLRTSKVWMDLGTKDPVMIENVMQIVRTFCENNDLSFQWKLIPGKE